MALDSGIDSSSELLFFYLVNKTNNSAMLDFNHAETNNGVRKAGKGIVVQIFFWVNRLIS